MKQLGHELLSCNERNISNISVELNTSRGASASSASKAIEEEVVVSSSIATTRRKQTVLSPLEYRFRPGDPWRLFRVWGVGLAPLLPMKLLPPGVRLIFDKSARLGALGNGKPELCHSPLSCEAELPLPGRASIANNVPDFFLVTDGERLTPKKSRSPGPPMLLCTRLPLLNMPGDRVTTGLVLPLPGFPRLAFFCVATAVVIMLISMLTHSPEEAISFRPTNG
mmetsp:Transcript_19450/g.54653  ORF Transcript_19450/g.54653 Transcript_19450/m.54653 type:complete len:224 (+) Transcript_19450:250-921(+)